MTEAQISRIDNLEIGRHGFGSITWRGLTDVRRLDLDQIICIDRGQVTLYSDIDKPPKGEGLNKEAVIRLNVKPSRAGGEPRDVAKWEARMREITEDHGNTFISYDLEVWIFRVPHFDG